jgi:hypothetical protein
VPFRNDRLTDFVDRLRLQLTNVVTNRAPLEFGVFVPRTDVHNGSQLDVIFRPVLQLIVRVISSKSCTGQHKNVPVIHPFTTTIDDRGPIDVSANQLHDSVGNVGLRIHVLQSSQNRYDAVATAEVQFDLIDGNTVQSQLSRV